MLVRLTYNCTPDSLGDVTQEDFIDALENELVADPRFRECALTVTFDWVPSGVNSVSVTDGECDDPEGWDEILKRMAFKAFAACLEPLTPEANMDRNAALAGHNRLFLHVTGTDPANEKVHVAPADSPYDTLAEYPNVAAADADLKAAGFRCVSSEPRCHSNRSYYERQ